MRTRWAPFAPLARRPAVLPGAYPALALLGFAAALAIQTAILGQAGFDPSLPFCASLVAIIAGLLGAKAWYWVLHPDQSPIAGGWAVDGFLVVFPLVAATVLHAWNQPIGTVFDAAAPGIFVAVAIGRVGCYLGGCCAGRFTTTSWGLWSSDGRIGAKRVPTQLLEAAAGLLLGSAAVILVLRGGVVVPGAVFVITFAAYAVLRQGLLRLRAERRRAPRTLPATAGASALVVVAMTAVALLHAA